MAPHERQILPLEKTGLVERAVQGEPQRRRHVQLRAPGRQAVSGAIETAQSLCEPLVPSMVIGMVAADPHRLG